MSINEIYPMRKRRSINKTPGKTPNRSSSNDVPLQTPKRFASNSSFNECEIVWDNHSPSPSRTLLGKRKKKTVSDEDGSDNNDIADMVKKLANKTGQTPQNSSLYNFWFNEQDSQSGAKTTNNSSGDKKKYMQTPAKRPTRKGRKSKVRLNKELEVLASMMQINEGNTKNAHCSNKEESSRSPTNLTTTSSPISPHQTTTKFKTPRDTKKLKTANTTKFSSPLSDIADIDWGDDDFDTMLSQVDISGLCEQEVITNTQRSDSEDIGALSSSFKENQPSWKDDDSLVTESWDFDDDSDELIQTLDQVERTQCTNSNNKVSDVKVNANTEKDTTIFEYLNQADDNELFQTLEQVEKMHNVEVVKVFGVEVDKHNVGPNNMSKGKSEKMHEQNVGQYTKLEQKFVGGHKQTVPFKTHLQNVNARQVTGEGSSIVQQSSSSPVKCTYSKEDIERKRLEAQQKRKLRLKLTNNRMNTRQNTGRPKR